MKETDKLFSLDLLTEAAILKAALEVLPRKLDSNGFDMYTFDQSVPL